MLQMDLAFELTAFQAPLSDDYRAPEMLRYVRTHKEKMGAVETAPLCRHC